jgi:hypothetical protein
MSESPRELELLRRVRAGELRIVHSQRARKLRRRGVRCWWEPYFAAYLWEPAR